MAQRRTEQFSFRVDGEVMDQVRAVARDMGVTNAGAVNVLLRYGLAVQGTVAGNLLAALHERGDGGDGR